ncbi:MAG: hypothetical protein WC943_16805 [Elusimicrobiota bacterium]|jgi:hypothetical protein
MARKLPLLACLLAGLALALGVVFVILERDVLPQVPLPPLGEGRRIGVFEPLPSPEAGRTGPRLAVVSVAPSGSLGVSVERPGAVLARLEKTLRSIDRRDGLPLMVEAAGRVDGADGRQVRVESVRPGDSRYFWAVLDRLRREGLTVEPAR